MDSQSGYSPNSADITWSAEGVPLSRTFGELYCNHTNGIGESRFLFLRYNNLQERWRQLAPHAVFNIAETGFGCGLNFLNVWQAWSATATPEATLHFISVERYPLRRHDLERALQLWPELAPQAQQLIAQYPSVDARGFHRLHFGRVHLTLIYADAAWGLQQMLPIALAGPQVERSDCGWTAQSGQADQIHAWFLDGFAPARNPCMWSKDLFRLIARLSGAGTTLATSTGDPAVHQRLDDVGFEVSISRHFDRKKEVIHGRFTGETEVTHSGGLPPASDHSAASARVRRADPSWHLCAGDGKAVSAVAVIGAGLAGCHSAFALAERGVKVTVIDRADIAAGASGNPQGVVYSKFSSSPGALADFNVTALTYALRFYHQRGFFRSCGGPCGVVQVAENSRQAQQYQAVAALFSQSPELVRWLEPAAASAAAGIAINHGGLWLPEAGWLNPARLCRALVDHPNIRVLRGQDVASLSWQHQQWSLLDDHGECITTSPAVIIACADSARRFSQCSLLPTKAIRGQVSCAQPTQGSEPLRAVLCGSGYIAPATDNGHCLGASFSLTTTDTALRWDEHHSNVQQIEALSPSLAALNITELEHGRASLRCTSPDYLPLVGPLPKQEQMIERFAIYRKNLNAVVDAPGEYWPGLYLNVAHGSKGLTYTPLCAELLASMITNQPLPLPRELVLRVHSARLLIRDLSRRRI